MTDYMGFYYSRAAWLVPVDAATQRLVLLCLAKHSDENGVSFPSAETISVETSLNRKTVFQTLRALKAKGLITVSRRDEKKNSNEYRLKLSTENGTYQKRNVPKTERTENGTKVSAENGTNSVPKTVREYRSNRTGNRTTNPATVAKAPATPHPRKPSALSCPEGISEGSWEASNAIRKSKRVGAWTPRAWELAVAAGRSCGMAPAEMLDYCISRGWAGFRKEYYKPASNSTASSSGLEF